MKWNILLAVCLAGLAFSACGKIFSNGKKSEVATVTLFYGAGYNNLSSDISANLQTIVSGKLPRKSSAHKMLSFTHLSVSDANFVTPTELYLTEHYTDILGNICADTLLTIPSDRTAADPEVLREVLEFIASRFPDHKYGVIVSSHGTGWLPAGVYGTSSYKPIQFGKKTASSDAELPLYNYNQDPDAPRVKTFMAEVHNSDGVNYSMELSIQSMAAAITVPLDYLIFDACLMGGVEVAYEFRGKVEKVGFSPAEVLTTGFNFSDMGLLISDNPSPEAFCEAYFNMYDSQSGSRRSATISLVQTSRMDRLADVCRGLFEKYRSSIAALRLDSGVQPYFRWSYHWFYDLEDILVKAGISASEKQELEAALDECIPYKAATPSFLSGSGGFDINAYSGLSMYLPSVGSSQLDGFYRTLAWNKATNLVE
ncbi:MAG: hypothetical protein IJ222_05865 [Bacteroidales bacterium]|nr:hypothetical protein [Bacteroidales bacterium]